MQEKKWDLVKKLFEGKKEYSDTDKKIMQSSLQHTCYKAQATGQVIGEDIKILFASKKETAQEQTSSSSWLIGTTMAILGVVGAGVTGLGVAALLDSSIALAILSGPIGWAILAAVAIIVTTAVIGVTVLSNSNSSNLESELVKDDAHELALNGSPNKLVSSLNVTVNSKPDKPLPLSIETAPEQIAPEPEIVLQEQDDHSDALKLSNGP